MSYHIRRWNLHAHITSTPYLMTIEYDRFVENLEAREDFLVVSVSLNLSRILNRIKVFLIDASLINFWYIWSFDFLAQKFLVVNIFEVGFVNNVLSTSCKTPQSLCNAALEKALTRLKNY